MSGVVAASEQWNWGWLSQVAFGFEVEVLARYQAAVPRQEVVVGEVAVWGKELQHVLAGDSSLVKEEACWDLALVRALWALWAAMAVVASPCEVKVVLRARWA